METFRIIVDIIFKITILWFMIRQTEINCDMVNRTTSLFELICKNVECVSRLHTQLENLKKNKEKTTKKMK